MMPGDLEPPGERGGGSTPESRPRHQHRPLIKDQHPQFNRPGRYGCAWRDGFGCGFRDALRLATREIDDPAVWSVLDEIASRYDLAGDQ